MKTYVWCEDSSSGYLFWKVLFNVIYPDFIVETQNGNSRLSKAVEKIDDDGNMYYIILDTAIDNPDILRELKRLKRSAFGKNNIRIIKIHSFEFALLSFKFLEQWVFAEKDELRDKRQKVLEARNIFINIINNGADSDILNEFKSVYEYQMKMNTEKISARILSEITKNTGFETNKTKIGSCFINNCCEWNERKKDDICGLDYNRLTVTEKMKQIFKHSVLELAFEEVGL
ncbi:MAG: hypothetical protein J6A58_10930 [Oscillospiraceae bacterium]|nr:hypothetical protein [Oscillospiraceae bacterium]